jgi:hypothetical protein
MEVKRMYKGKDVDMLMATETIMNSALAHQSFLVTKRVTWTVPFLTAVKDEIEIVLKKHLGIDNAKELRAATSAVKKIQEPALFHLAELKVQIEADFKEDPEVRDELLNTLGYKSYNADAKKYDQEALINLLYQFKTNATPTLIITASSKGANPEIFDKIISFADELKGANVKQEGKKGTKKEITQEAIIDFNGIYNKVIPIAKISANLFKNNPAAKEQFSYSKVKQNLNFTKKKPDPNS